MKTFFIEEPLAYDGTQLHSHFAYKKVNLSGDSVVAFCGPCKVATEAMVDLEDVLAGASIVAADMLHIIVEHFEDDLLRVIAWQRLLCDLVIEEIHESVDGLRLIRRGDDVYDAEGRKLTVSIATKSATSCLIHLGINIDPTGAPVMAVGLKEWDLNPRAIATGVMNRYREEITSMRHARAKVRGTS